MYQNLILRRTYIQNTRKKILEGPRIPEDWHIVTVPSVGWVSKFSMSQTELL